MARTGGSRSPCYAGYYSGGRFRDFVRFVADLAGECWDDDAPQATLAHVDKMLDRWRRLYEAGLNADQIALLREAKDSQTLPGGEAGYSLIQTGHSGGLHIHDC